MKGGVSVLSVNFILLIPRGESAVTKLLEDIFVDNQGITEDVFLVLPKELRNMQKKGGVVY